jgi:drug/metabolite transporter (DMT)-like permease
MPEGVGRVSGRSGTSQAASPQAGPAQAAVLAAAYGAVLLWGATPMVTKVAVTDVSPLAVGLLRTLCGSVLALPLLAAGRFRAPGRRRGRFALAVSALGGFVVFPVLFSLGLGRTSAGHGALLLGILPVLTGLIAALVEKRVPGARWWLGCAVAVAGTALLVGARFDLAAGGSSWIGDVLVLAGAVAAAAGYVAGAIAAREIGTWPVTLWGLTIGGVVLLPVAPFVISPAALAGAPALALSAIAYLALGSSIVAYAAWYWALGHGGIGRTGLAQFAQPIVGLVLAVGLLGEPLTWLMTLAAATILGGVALARGAK